MLNIIKILFTVTFTLIFFVTKTSKCKNSFKKVKRDKNLKKTRNVLHSGIGYGFGLGLYRTTIIVKVCGWD